MSIFNTIESSIAHHYFKQINKSSANTFKKISSGTRLSSVTSDYGAKAVSLSVNSEKVRINGIKNNIQNAISYLEVQDGLLETAENIFLRINQLKRLHETDPLIREGSDLQDLYDREFEDLVAQIHEIIDQKFMGRRLFADPLFIVDDSITISLGSDPSHNVTISPADLDFALGLTIYDDDGDPSSTLDEHGQWGFDIDLADFSDLRTNNASLRERLTILSESFSRQTVSTVRALERISSVDLASETTSLAKQSILLQASSSMLVQANFSTGRVEALLGI